MSSRLVLGVRYLKRPGLQALISVNKSQTTLSLMRIVEETMLGARSLLCVESDTE